MVHCHLAKKMKNKKLWYLNRLKFCCVIWFSHQADHSGHSNYCTDSQYMYLWNQLCSLPPCFTADVRIQLLQPFQGSKIYLCSTINQRAAFLAEPFKFMIPQLEDGPLETNLGVSPVLSGRPLIFLQAWTLIEEAVNVVQLQAGQLVLSLLRKYTLKKQIRREIKCRLNTVHRDSLH